MMHFMSSILIFFFFSRDHIFKLFFQTRRLHAHLIFKWKLGFWCIHSAPETCNAQGKLKAQLDLAFMGLMSLSSEPAQRRTANLTAERSLMLGCTTLLAASFVYPLTSELLHPSQKTSHSFTCRWLGTVPTALLTEDTINLHTRTQGSLCGSISCPKHRDTLLWVQPGVSNCRHPQQRQTIARSRCS